ncbi:MAG: hypothetical protein KKE02_13470 [Alphaproteobacteria bacterium]|nr:hypothetical protein [Alphaproteobacteria bacterium]MBU1516952.1 hypothetical protein [Alphaproteobacteria bacterium]MBU2095840.1 hypothetical protein [Alphaproteobacteria bacterium]MBU2152023.1 hypothetical protein [Alphaproteobacteria bacterium]MBU2309544.1 hypothetical protein [Alphaproteobacteria bacterium]
MRKTILGFVLAAGLAGGAQAADYVLVKSSDPALKPGLELDAGERVALGAGQTAMLMSASGSVSTLRGAAGGVVAPRAGAQADPARMAALKALVAPAPTGSTFGARRSGVCPDPATLTTLDQILSVQSGGCAAQARIALDAYVAEQAKP